MRLRGDTLRGEIPMVNRGLLRARQMKQPWLLLSIVKLEAQWAPWFIQSKGAICPVLVS